MKNKVFMGLAAVVMVAFLSGCGKVPQAQIDAANAAIENAKVVEANVYIPAEFAALQDSMKAVSAVIETQKSKLFKNFGESKTKLEQVVALAAKVAGDAAAKKEEIKKQATGLLTEIKALIEENKTLITKAPRGKEGAAVLEQIKSEMTTIENSVTEAQSMFDKGAFMDAFNKVKAAKDSAAGINTELKEAIAKVRGR